MQQTRERSTRESKCHFTAPPQPALELALINAKPLPEEGRGDVWQTQCINVACEVMQILQAPELDGYVRPLAANTIFLSASSRKSRG